MSQILYQFSGKEFAPLDWCDPARHTTLVADSWRLEEGLVVAWEKHWDRFRGSVLTNTTVSSLTLDAFRSALVDILPKAGSWFPRIEAIDTPGGATLRYRQREAPPWNSEVVVAIAPHDPRKFPLTKGPDLEALMALRREVEPLGATEAIIVDDAGLLAEGAYSSLMVWPSGSDIPHVISPTTPHLPGVTESVLKDIATEQGIDIKESSLSVTDLEGAELWILSALHGIRMATSFIDGPTPSVNTARRDQWQHLWRQRGVPISQTPNG